MPRPRTVTWLALAVFLLSASNLLRAAHVFLNEAYLAQLRLSVSPTYLGLSGLIWAIVLGAASAGLWRMRRWARWLTLGAVSLYHLQAWLTRILFEVSADARQVWPWQAAVSLLRVGMTWGILWWPGIRSAFDRETGDG
ncbi:MAG: hypothetical protein HY260_15175 [Chloroflexi bacterium]|nr:hypothetical protein [Chloroflexota bacterium]